MKYKDLKNEDLKKLSIEEIEQLGAILIVGHLADDLERNLEEVQDDSKI